MIRFLDTAFIGGKLYTAGMIGDFDNATENQLITEGDAEAFSTTIKPIEALAASAVPMACALSAVDEVLGSFMIPDGVLTATSILQIEPLWTYPSSANNKILKVKVAGTTVYTATRTTSVKEAPLVVLANRNSMTSQIAVYEGNHVTASAVTPATYTIDLSGNVTVEITAQRASASESVKLEYYRASHFSI